MGAHADGQRQAGGILNQFHGLVRVRSESASRMGKKIAAWLSEHLTGLRRSKILAHKETLAGRSTWLS